MADAQPGQLRLLEVGSDPDVTIVDEGEEGLARLHHLPLFDLAARHHAGPRGGDGGVRQLQLRVLTDSGGGAQACLGQPRACLSARDPGAGADRLTLKALQRGGGIGHGELRAIELLARDHLLVGELLQSHQVRLRLLEHGLRRPSLGLKRPLLAGRRPHLRLGLSGHTASASHDARQPLQVIALLFQSFQKSSHASDADKHTIAKIDVNLQTIRNLFDRVLDISRIDSGTITPQLESIPLQALFDKLDAQFGTLAAARGLWLRFAPTQACVLHDPQLLERIASNLVHNALKYTTHGGVWVGWRAARGQLEVRDSGLGISLADQATIFQEFAQLDNPKRDNQEHSTERHNEAGLGLGLSIVKRLADLTHTPLGLRSAPARGSTFWLKLPLAAPLPTSPPTPAAKSPTLGGPQLLRHLHILYAEDHAPLRALITSLLQNAGATVHPCADVGSALALLRSGAAVNLVLTDYRLGPSGTGLDVVHAARAQHSAALPAVLLTGDTAVKDLASIQQLAHTTLLHKPVDGDQLLLALHTAAA